MVQDLRLISEAVVSLNPVVPNPYTLLSRRSYTSGKGLITRIYRELKKLNSQKINDRMKKWANELNEAFSKEEVQISKKKTHEKMLTIPGHKGNANQNHVKVPPYSC
jgi:hypothetical protein